MAIVLTIYTWSREFAFSSQHILPLWTCTVNTCFLDGPEAVDYSTARSKKRDSRQSYTTEHQARLHFFGFLVRALEQLCGIDRDTLRPYRIIQCIATNVELDSQPASQAP